MAKKRKPSAPRIFAGVAAAPGIAVGPARRWDDPLEHVDDRRIAVGAVEAEIQRFHLALERARGELQELRRATELEWDEDTAKIFDVQLLVLEDPMAVDRTVEAIREERHTAAYLFRRHMLEASESLQELSDAYFSDRAVDLLDVKRRVLRHLAGGSDDPSRAQRRGVVLSRELAPSEAVRLDPHKVLGLATDAGGATSHAAIMARARGIPAVVGAKGLCETVRDGDILAVDGFRGVVEINPSPDTVESFRNRRRVFTRLRKRLARRAAEPAVTLDGHRIGVAANMEMPAELDTILEMGGEGVGLFRTEFFFMQSRQSPSEEEQTKVYRQVLRRTGRYGADIRVLDVGGDKVASYMGMVRERNPFLGLRGIRYLMAHPGLFRTQVRAILRAAAGKPEARILFPMVTSVDEFRVARELIDAAVQSLSRRGVRFDAKPSLGVMIEVPSAVWMADELAREADFLSVGSNDLVQYLLAIDRDNQALLPMYKPRHPAVLRAMQQVVAAADRHGKQVSICGEMAGDPISIPFLIGLGFHRLSVSPFLIPDVKQIVRVLNFASCRRLVDRALGEESPDAVDALLREEAGDAYHELLAMFSASNGKTVPPRGPRRRTSS